MTEDAAAVAAHQAAQTHHYMMPFPPHPARTADPHYADFNAYHKAHRATARCYIGERIGFGDCKDAQLHPAPAPASRDQPGLELHHAHVEFSPHNAVALPALQTDAGGAGAAGTSSVSSVTTRPAITWAAASAGAVAIAATFPAWSNWAGTNGEVVTNISVWDASSSGNFLFSVLLTLAKTINTGDTATLSSMTMTFTPIAA